MGAPCATWCMSLLDEDKRKSREQPSKTIEDYLLNIYTLSGEGRPVIAARLAETMQVAPPTVTATLQRMVRRDLISINEHREVLLTQTGHGEAETMVRRHRLAERLLIDILGLDWADVHEEAHRFEHAISPRVEERILAVLGHPTTCPHGSPIPGSGVSQRSDAIRLETVSPGDHLVVERISEEAENDRELLAYFQRSALLPGREFDVAELEPYNSLIVLRNGGDAIPVSMHVAHQIWVRKRLAGT
ncbi:MAG: metal-dependent transcriptional regulator [Chloroflexi bacterium]|nr:metal-dependent transcriptional regulator [Chloroflexota bacterium]